MVFNEILWVFEVCLMPNFSNNSISPSVISNCRWVLDMCVGVKGYDAKQY